jgi:hypothetical protein
MLPAQIIVTELGDETFIIAALMAMRHPKIIVYAGAMSALSVMTVSSRCFVIYGILRAAEPRFSPAMGLNSFRNLAPTSSFFLVCSHHR